MTDKTPLTYEPPAPSIPRWQFRLLFLLVLLNLVITLQSTYAPGVAAAAKQWWAERKETRRIAALEQVAATWTEPPSKVVWDDDPAAAAPLLSGPGYAPVGVPAFIESNYPFLVGWPAGAAARPPPVGAQLFKPHFPLSKDGLVQSDEHFAVVFMHLLRSTSGQERLVYVYLKGSTDLNMAHIPAPPGGYGSPPDAFEAQANRKLRLIAVPCQPAQGTTLPKTLSQESTGLSIVRGADQWKLDWKWVPSADRKSGQVVPDARNRFRFFAGQADPADPSRFTIAFEHDGRPGTVRGRLKDDGTIELQPDAGTVTGDRWDPGTQ